MLDKRHGDIMHLYCLFSALGLPVSKAAAAWETEPRTGSWVREFFFAESTQVLLSV